MKILEKNGESVLGYLGAFLTAIVFLFLPGTIIGACLGLPNRLALAVSPAISVAIYSLTGEANKLLNIETSWFACFAVAMIIAVLLLVIVSISVSRNRQLHERATRYFRFSSKQVSFALLYVFCGLAASLFMIVLPLGNDLTLFNQAHDNLHHLSATRVFLETGVWSSLDVSNYATDISPLGNPSFYPMGWHFIVAMVSQCTGAHIAVSINIVNIAFISIVYQLGMYALMRQLFPGNHRALAFGSICALAFGYFPWNFMVFGPLYPNMASFCVLPALWSCFIWCLSQRFSLKSIKGLAVFFLGLAGVILLHTNGLFTAYLFLVPFCVHKIGASETRLLDSRWKKVVAQIIFIIAAVCLWLIAYDMPAMHYTTHRFPDATSSLVQAIADVATLSLAEYTQIALAALVAIGGLALLLSKERRWLVIPYLYVCVTLIVICGTGSSLKSLLGGFWYVVDHRIAGMLALFGTPLAAYGLYAVSNGLSKLINACKVEMRRPCLGEVCLYILFVVLFFYPSCELKGLLPVTNMSSVMKDSLAWEHSPYKGLYDAEERAFVEEVKESVGAEVVIANYALDGSEFAYGNEGLNVYFREGTETWLQNMDVGNIVRCGLSNVRTDEEVRYWVDELGIEYLMVLDYVDLSTASPEELEEIEESPWKDMIKIQDGTPGFELVLSEGDMRLYKIVKD